MKCNSCGEDIPLGLSLKAGDQCPFCMAVISQDVILNKDIPSILSDYSEPDGSLRTLSDEEIDKAFQELTYASEQGSGKAEYLLGQMYNIGITDTPNKARAKQLFQSAAHKGIQLAQKALLEL